MKRDAMSKQVGQTWIVISGGRLLPASLRQPLASKRSGPDLRPSTNASAPIHRPECLYIPLSRRPVLRDH